MNEYIGHFSLWGDFEIEEITVLMGIQPSEVFRKGELLEGADFPARTSTWDLYCPASCKGMGEQINALLGILWPKSDVLKPLASKFTAELNVSSSCSNGSDVFSLDQEILQKLAALNLKLNFFYTCDEDQDAN